MRRRLLKQGIAVSTMDLLSAFVALNHNLTLVTNSTPDYQWL
jgi:predicted nucleic acid-binding protein